MNDKLREIRESLKEARRYVWRDPEACRVMIADIIGNIMMYGISNGLTDSHSKYIRISMNLSVSGRFMVSHPEVAESYIDGAIFELATDSKHESSSEPRYHNYECRNCVFIGQFRDRDLYFCIKNNGPTVIARHGNNDSDYTSGFGSQDEALIEAEKRATNIGLLQSYYKYVTISDTRYNHHGCKSCVFLGPFENYDLYYCFMNDISTVIARYGNSGSDYSSGLGTQHTGLVEAEKRAREMGLLK